MNYKNIKTSKQMNLSVKEQLLFRGDHLSKYAVKIIEELEQLTLTDVGVTLPSREEVYSNACEYARNVQNPNRNIILTLRQAFKHGAEFVKNKLPLQK